jgi:hypothetical protein
LHVHRSVALVTQLVGPLGIARQDLASLIGTVDPARVIDAERTYLQASSSRRCVVDRNRCWPA